MTTKRRFLVGSIVALLATLVTLALGEVVLRVVCASRNIYNIEMVKYARELKTRDPRGFVSHVHRPSRSARLMGVDIALNSLGDRGPELVEPKPPGTKRVLVLGSSITMGWGVPFDEVFTSLAQRRLNDSKPFGPDVRFEFVNAGIGNYNTVFQHQLFLDQYPHVRPDLVVLNYFISDVQPRTMGRDNALLKYSYLAAFCFDRFGQWQFRRGKKDLFTFFKEFYDDSPAWRLTQEKIRDMHDRCMRDNVPFAVMVVPDIHDLAPATPFGTLYTQMDTTFRGMGLPVLNAFPPFQEKFGNDPSKLWIQSDDPHPNAAGHALMGSLLTDFITKENPLRLPPSPPR